MILLLRKENKLMKLFKKFFLLGLTFFLTTGCSLTKDSLEDATIYSTVYPIEYLTNFLYSDYATIESIYPNGADISSYELTDKQIKEYAKGDLFIYNGLGNEKNIAKDLINQNDNLLIIDAANSLNYINGIEELWMSPNNYLMLAKNIKDYLIEYLNSNTLIESVNTKYDELEEILSIKDADLRAIGKEAKENGTNALVVSNNVFKYLESYNFEIISLDEETLTESTLNSIDNNFDNGNYNTLIVLDNNYTDNINKIIEEYEPEVIDISSMTVSNDESEDYLTTMQNFIDKLRNLCLAD